MNDTLCLTQDACSPGFSFLAATSQQGLSALHASGIIGLSPEPIGSSSISDLFLLKMKESGVIEQGVFSFTIRSGEEPSTMTLGGYDESLAVDWHPLVNDSEYWEVRL